MGQAPSQPERSGLQKLNDLVTDLHNRGDLTKYTHPIVLVPGFNGFGEPLFGSINYWGGFEDLASELRLHTGLPVILPRIGPISSNWERACELYCQLYGIQRSGPGTGFDTCHTSPPTPITVDYGQYITLPPPTPGTLPTPPSTKQAVVLGALPESWQWDRDHPVHMICHSQDGNTIRLLDILRDVQVREVISRLVVSASLNPTRFVDLQLGHWGFTPNPGEGFLNMHRRLRDDILAWWNSDNNGIRDNGILGIARLNADFSSPPVFESTYYFTMSFDATKPFPQENLSGKDLGDLPVNSALSFFRLYPGPSNVTANAASFLSSLVHKLFGSFPGNPSDIDFAQWAVKTVNNHASALGYEVRIPSPGGRIPREDMLPILSIFSLGMSGVNAPFGPSEKNDGVVDTASMCGPAGNQIQNIVNPNWAEIISKPGVYWHFGVTEGIDHADQVGVFTDDVTYGQVLQMYKDLGDLVSFLP